MLISHASDIGLRALVVLAGRGDELTTVAALAGELGVPERYLGKTVQRLAGRGWVATTRGHGGGLHATAAGRQASVAEVIGAFEERRRAVNCEEPPCPLASRDCRLRGLLTRAEDAFLASMADVRVADLV